MALEEFLASHIDPRPAGIATEHGNRVIEVQCIMRTIFTEGNDCR